MKFKLLGTAILSSALVLTACGQSEDSKKDNDKKSESKSDKKSNNPKKETKKDDNKKKDKKSSNENNQNQSTEQNTNQQQSTEQTQQSNNQKQDKPGTDAGLINPKDVNDESQSNDGNQSVPKDVNSEINSAQTEEDYYNALRKKYHGGLSSGELQTKHAIENGYYDENNADEVYQKIQNEEQKIQNGEYDQYK